MARFGGLDVRARYVPEPLLLLGWLRLRLLLLLQPRAPARTPLLLLLPPRAH